MIYLLRDREKNRIVELENEIENTIIAGNYQDAIIAWKEYKWYTHNIEKSLSHLLNSLENKRKIYFNLINTLVNGDQREKSSTTKVENEIKNVEIKNKINSFKGLAEAIIRDKLKLNIYKNSFKSLIDLPYFGDIYGLDGSEIEKSLEVLEEYLNKVEEALEKKEKELFS